LADFARSISIHKTTDVPPIRAVRIATSLHLVAINPKAYASRMSKKPRPLSRTREGQMKLIAILLYIAEQKQKSLDTMEQLFIRLMRPSKD
jgi:hypothetical protein